MFSKSRVVITFFATLFILALAGCGGGSGVSASTATPTTVSGVVSKGPLVGATVCAYAITDGVKGTDLGMCATTDNSGNYSIDLGAYKGAVLFEAAGGSYIDEATGSSIALNSPLRSMLNNTTGGQTSVAVTALTELAYQETQIMSGGLTSTNILYAITNVQNNFGLTDIIHTLPANALNVPANATSEQKAYAFALATISQYQNNQPLGTTLGSVLQALLDCLASPVACGTGNSSLGADLNTAAIAFQNSHVAFAGMPSPAIKFGSIPFSSNNSYQTITIAGLNRPHQISGTLIVGNYNAGTYVSIIDTLNITKDGTYIFPTPYAAGDTRLAQIIQNPVGQKCDFTSIHLDDIDPYTGQPVTDNTAQIYCYESPCGDAFSLGMAPAPRQLRVTRDPDPFIASATNPVIISWEEDPWAFSYSIYYGTDPNVVTTDPLTGFAVYQHKVTGLRGFGTQTIDLPTNDTYYFSISSHYDSPSYVEFCQSSASSPVAYSGAQTAVSGMNPTQGAAGISVIITGTGFSATPANNVVTFNGVQGTVTAATPISLTVTVPAGATTGPVTLTTPAGIAISAGTFTVDGATTQPSANPPTITSITPSSAAPGTTVLIKGTGFDATAGANNVVTFNGVQAEIPFKPGATYLQATVPWLATTGPVTVTTSASTAAATGSFTVLTNTVDPATGLISDTACQKYWYPILLQGGGSWRATSAIDKNDILNTDRVATGEIVDLTFTFSIPFGLYNYMDVQGTGILYGTAWNATGSDLLHYWSVSLIPCRFNGGGSLLLFPDRYVGGTLYMSSGNYNLALVRQ